MTSSQWTCANGKENDRRRHPRRAKFAEYSGNRREGSLSCSPVKTALMVITAFYHADAPLCLSGIATRAGRDRSAKDGAYAAPWDMPDVTPSGGVYS